MIFDISFTKVEIHIGDRPKNNLGLMLKEGLLKENIDGEAIQWAFNRIKKKEKRREKF